MRTTNGEITAAELAGRLVATTVNGAITGRNLNGGVEARAVNGPVTIEIRSLGDELIELRTVNGELNLTLPGNARANLSASVTNGVIDTSGLIVGPDGRADQASRTWTPERRRHTDRAVDDQRPDPSCAAIARNCGIQNSQFMIASSFRERRQSHPLPSAEAAGHVVSLVWSVAFRCLLWSGLTLTLRSVAAGRRAESARVLSLRVRFCMSAVV